MLDGSSAKEFARHRSELNMGTRDYQLLHSDHIPYDEWQIRLRARLNEKDGKVFEEKLQKHYPCVHDELKRIKDIDIKELKPHIEKYNRGHSVRNLKMIQDLFKVKNHQAFWIHNEKKEEDRARMQVQADNENPNQNFFAKPNSKMTHVKSYIMVQGKLIPSIKYKAKQKIYNRFKIEEEGSAIA